MGVKPFLRSSTRPQSVECFFCLSPALLAPETGASRKGKEVGQVGSRRNWHCKRCGCWNVRDSKGEMISDLPAMHNSALNERSFALRAKPSKNRLPIASSSTSPFCRSCLANQTLIMNMLTNYLPDDDDPTFDSLYAALPTYLVNLHARYPPVCSICQPGVDDILRKSDQKARGEVWTRALRRGKQHSQEGLHGSRVWRVWMWRLCGVIYCAGLAGSLAMCVTAWLVPDELRKYVKTVPDSTLGAFVTFLLISAVIGVLWDPYWRRRARLGDQGKVRGRRIWQLDHGAILLLRCLIWRSVPFCTLKTQIRALTSSELLFLVHAVYKFRLSQPVALRLVRPVSLTCPPTPTTAQAASQYTEPPPLSALSLSHDPLQHANPVFGESSLQRRPARRPDPSEAEPMDWEPAPAMLNGSWTRPLDWDEDDEPPTPRKSDWDRFGVQKQRMFPRQTGNEETGLESLIAGWGIGGETGRTQRAQEQDQVAGGQARGGEMVISITPRGLINLVFGVFGIARMVCIGLALRAYLLEESYGDIVRLDWPDKLGYAEVTLQAILTGMALQLPHLGRQTAVIISIMACRAAVLAAGAMKEEWLASGPRQAAAWVLWAALDFITCLT